MPYMKRQLQWISRTVMVKDNDVAGAMKVNCNLLFISKIICHKETLGK